MGAEGQQEDIKMEEDTVVDVEMIDAGGDEGRVIKMECRSDLGEGDVKRQKQEVKRAVVISPAKVVKSPSSQEAAKRKRGRPPKGMPVNRDNKRRSTQAAAPNKLVILAFVCKSVIEEEMNLMEQEESKRREAMVASPAALAVKEVNLPLNREEVDEDKRVLVEVEQKKNDRQVETEDEKKEEKVQEKENDRIDPYHNIFPHCTKIVGNVQVSCRCVILMFCWPFSHQHTPTSHTYAHIHT